MAICMNSGFIVVLITIRPVFGSITISMFQETWAMDIYEPWGSTSWTWKTVLLNCSEEKAEVENGSLGGLFLILLT